MIFSPDLIRFYRISKWIYGHLFKMDIRRNRAVSVLKITPLCTDPFHFTRYLHVTLWTHLVESIIADTLLAHMSQELLGSTRCRRAMDIHRQFHNNMSDLYNHMLERPGSTPNTSLFTLLYCYRFHSAVLDITLFSYFYNKHQLLNGEWVKNRMINEEEKQ